MKAIIKIEQFGNGISMKWVSPDVDPQSEVALDFEKEKAIGKMIWDDIRSVMDAELCDEVEMSIEYKPIKDGVLQDNQ